MLADARVVGSLDKEGKYRVQQLETAELKGIARPVTMFSIVSGDDQPRGGGDAPPIRSRAPGWG